MNVLLLSTYDLGRQPFGLASPAAWLERAGHEVQCLDLSRDRLEETVAARAGLIGIYLPMHTATRLALAVIDRLKVINPAATIAAYGLYAPLSASLLISHGVDAILGPEAERDIVDLAAGKVVAGAGGATAIPRLPFVTPSRRALPPVTRYASLQLPDGTRRAVGATDSTRGCKHRCRHCPIVPVYDGQFRVVPVDVVLDDIDQQVAGGAEHITFGDPDFFNGPTHARRIIEGLHARHPHLTYDVTIKVSHLLAHRDLTARLRPAGCLFVTTAVESIDDAVLMYLEKGHTRADFAAAVALCRDLGLTLSPTFVAFTPWTTLEGFDELLDLVESLDLIEHVSPVQWGLRLLITGGSRLLELDDIRSLVGAFNEATLTYPWRHPDARVDALQHDIMKLVGVKLTGSRSAIFADVRGLVARAMGRPAFSPAGPSPYARTAIPYLDEPWYC